MRHRKKFNHLSRKSAHRKAMLANMASSLIQHKRINTTLAKAKALRVFVEPLITRSKTDSTHSRRMVFRYLRDKHAVTELFREVAPKITDRQGGYTRILKTGNRLGDAAEMCFIELVDFNETYIQEKETKTTKTRRRRKSSKKKTESEAASPVTPVEKETKIIEEPSDKPSTDSEESEDILETEEEKLSADTSIDTEAKKDDSEAEEQEKNEEEGEEPEAEQDKREE